MPARLSIGLAQWHATDDPEDNLAKAERCVARCAAAGARVVLLPENGLMLSSGPRMREQAFSVDSPVIGRLCSAARLNHVAVIAGGAKFRDNGRITNRALVIDASGRLAGSYDKIHLFDARVGGQSFEASRVEEAGNQPTIVEVDGWRLGLTICYDIRFPQLYASLAGHGAQVLLVPSAFTRITGQAHWETLVRARAIETGCYVVASATVTPPGVTGDAFETYGHAMIVDPWGAVLDDLGEEPEAVSVVELDIEAVERARAALPVLSQARPDAYSRQVQTIRLLEGTDVRRH